MEESANNILAIYSSPKEDSLSGLLLDMYLARVFPEGSVSKVYTASIVIEPCIACGKCGTSFHCVFSDAMTDIYPLILNADVILFAFPVYFTSLPSTLKALVDRCQLIWEMKKNKIELKPKRGIAVGVAGSDFPGAFDPSITTLKHLMNAIGGKLDMQSSLLVFGSDNRTREDILSEAEIFLSGASSR